MNYDTSKWDRFRGWYWEERLIWICLYIILSQWNETLIPYWYEETTSMTELMLSIMLYVGLIIPAFNRTRFLIGLMIVYWSIFRELMFMNEWVGWRAADNWKDWVIQVHPYLWLVGLLWVTYEIFRKFVNTGGHIVMLLVIQLIVIGILDSFTVEILWDQAAWMMGASLLWLIAVHFRNMRLKYESSWSRSRRYTLQMIASAVVLMSLIISIGVSVPSLRPLLEDPYTSWIQSDKPGAGGRLDGNDTGKVSKNGQSGYSVNDTKLGGGFNMDFTPVMLVNSELRGYWRGESKSQYSGEGWTDYKESGSTTQVVEGDPLLQEMPPADDVTTRIVKQSFTMLNQKKYTVLFGMAAMDSFNLTDAKANSQNGLGLTVWFQRDEELRYSAGASQPYPMTYTIESKVIEASDTQLRDASKISDGAFEGDQWLPYLQLPDPYSDRVQQLAKTITNGAKNNYDRAKMIESYLREQYSYTTTPNLELKQSTDFVDSFLFEVKEGYCDYFSSAMAIMLRTLDVPTRWVKGYASGSNDASRNGLMPDEMLERFSDPDKGGTFRVTNADAHSWVEVYLGDYGWVSFEPTPGFTMPRMESAQDKEAVERERELLAQSEAEKLLAKDKELSLPKWVGTAAQIVLLLALLFGLLVLFMRWRSVGYSMRWIRLYRRDLTFAQRIVLETELWLGFCRIRGLRRGSDETLREAVRRWHQTEEQVMPSAVSIVRLFEQAKYGVEPMTDVEYQELKLAIRNYKQTRKAS